MTRIAELDVVGHPGSPDDLLADLGPDAIVYLPAHVSGHTIPSDAVTLALDLEWRGVTQRIGPDGTYEAEAADGLLTEGDRASIGRYRRQLGTIVRLAEHVEQQRIGDVGELAPHLRVAAGGGGAKSLSDHTPPDRPGQRRIFAANGNLGPEKNR